MGAEELMHHAEERLGIHMGGTTPDGMFTLERAECQAACTEAPCLQVNYRYRFRVTPQNFDDLVNQLSSGQLTEEIPQHGTLAVTRQHIPADRGVGAVDPELVTEGPAWLDGKAAL
jgi:NADH-quinone oxidoreductase subunit E